MAASVWLDSRWRSACRWLLPVVCLVLLSSGCRFDDGRSSVDASASASGNIDLNQCGSIACPSTCSTPDGGWSNRPGPDAGPCPPPPSFEGAPCVQVVLGRLTDTARYMNCPGYVVLNRSDWTPTMNDQFIACAAAGGSGATCVPPILIASPNGSIPNAGDGGAVTSTELCQLNACGCDVQVVDGAQGSVNSCP